MASPYELVGPVFLGCFLAIVAVFALMGKLRLLFHGPGMLVGACDAHGCACGAAAAAAGGKCGCAGGKCWRAGGKCGCAGGKCWRGARWPPRKPPGARVTLPLARPTPRPTVRPTVRPTSRPTVRPTVRPTSRPTVRPTCGGHHGGGVDPTVLAPAGRRPSAMPSFLTRTLAARSTPTPTPYSLRQPFVAGTGGAAPVPR